MTADNRALRSIALQFFINGTVFAAFVPRLPEIRDALNMSLYELGVVLMLGSLGGIAASFSFKYINQFLGLKKTMVCFAWSMMLFLPYIAFSNNVYHLVIAIVCLHFSDVLVDISMNIQGSQLSARREVPVINRLHGIWSIGTVVGAGLAALFLFLGVSLQAHLLIITMLLAAILLYAERGLVQTLDAEEKKGQGGTWGKMGLLFMLLGASAVAPEVASSDWSAFRLVDDLNNSNQVAAFGFFAFVTGMVIGRMSGDYTVKALGSVRTLRYGVYLTILGLVLAFFIDLNAMVFLGLFSAGIGCSVIFPGLYDRAAMIDSSGAILGAMTAGSRMGVLLCPVLIGGIAEVEGFSVGLAISVVALPALFAILFSAIRVQTS